MQTTVYLARHAATISNLKRPYVLQGSGVDQDLDPRGVRQAEALGTELSRVRLDAIYASPLKRALQTAEAVATRHGLDVQASKKLLEAHTGVWEGKDWNEIRTNWPVEFAGHEEDPALHGYPGGESFDEVLRRSSAEIESLCREHAGGTILIVGHNVVNRVCLAHWMNLPLRFTRRIPQNNAGYNILDWAGNRMKVRSINVTVHLEGLIPED